LVDVFGQALDALCVVVGHVVRVLFSRVGLEQLTLCMHQFILGQLEWRWWLQ
jgi:hypothetical protein